MLNVNNEGPARGSSTLTNMIETIKKAAMSAASTVTDFTTNQYTRYIEMSSIADKFKNTYASNSNPAVASNLDNVAESIQNYLVNKYSGVGGITRALTALVSSCVCGKVDSSMSVSLTADANTVIEFLRKNSTDRDFLEPTLQELWSSIVIGAKRRKSK